MPFIPFGASLSHEAAADSAFERDVEGWCFVLSNGYSKEPECVAVSLRAEVGGPGGDDVSTG